jgi:uncharacterized protein (DUF58 family)
MISPEILKKIQEIKIKTRRVMNGALVGGHVTRQKGFGFEFDQIRTYSYGDDIRFMDWKSSARTGKLLVRQYLEEKNRTIMLCLDVSASTFFASVHEKTSDVMQQITAILACVADLEQDHVGLLLFSDHVEKIIPPSRGKRHVMAILQAIFSHQPVGKKTDFNFLFSYLVQSFTKDAAVMIVSDFLGSDFEQSLKLLACKREIIAIRCLDSMIGSLPSLGYVWSKDSETGVSMLLPLSHKNSEYQHIAADRLVYQTQLLQKYKIDCVDIASDQNFVESLIVFFKRRMMVLS